MDASFVSNPQVQKLLDKASGISETGGDARTKAIMRDLLEGIFTVIARHQVTEDEFWLAIKFLGDGVGEFGLLAAGTGIEHFLDLCMDAMDREAGLTGGTPRTIEGPLYVSGAPLLEVDSNLTIDPDEGAETLHMHGSIRGPDGEPAEDAILHVWHANSKGWYSHFDPTGEQSPFNNRGRIKVGKDGRFAFHSKMPSGYSVPPGGATDQLMRALGRHGNRPAHVHFFVEAPGYRTLTTQINFGDDPFAADDFAFATRDGLLPVPEHKDGEAFITFDFELQRAPGGVCRGLSARARAAAEHAEQG